MHAGTPAYRAHRARHQEGRFGGQGEALIRVALLVDIPFALSATGADHLARGMAVVEDGAASVDVGGR